LKTGFDVILQFFRAAESGLGHAVVFDEVPDLLVRVQLW
jgi:hypothetical protein